jgi:penicillin-binding protein 1A
MEDAGFLSSAERQEAAERRLTFKRATTEQIAPYFVEYVRMHAVAQYGEAMVYKGGLEISSTLNVPMQTAAEQALRNGLRVLDKRQGWRGPLGTQDVTALLDQQPQAVTSALKEGDLLQGVVLKVGREYVQVSAGSVVGRLSFDDMAWARRRLRGRDPVKDVTVLPSVKSLLKPGDVIEVGVKRVGKEGVEFRLEQTPLVEGALLAVDPRNGAIRAMVGGYDFARSEYNRTVLAHRQPGSAFKPIIYATALSQGMSPATVVVDAPVVYENEDEPEKTWKPANYENRFYGKITLREALIHSRNLATVRLLERVGVKPVVEFAESLGIASSLNRDLSLALGSSGVTLLELTAAYGTFANQGIRLEPYAVSQVIGSGGEMLEQHLFEPKQVISKETAYLITNVMEDVIQRGTGQLAKSLDRQLAGKTGTTNDYTDAWFIGFAPNLVVGVWVGFDDIRTLGETESGAHAALPIWVEFMREVLPALPVMNFEMPEDVQSVRVDPATGLLPTDRTREGATELFAKGTEPTESAPTYVDPADFYRLDVLPEPAPSSQPTP